MERETRERLRLKNSVYISERREKFVKNAKFLEQFLGVCYRVITWNFISVWLSGYMISAGKSIK